MRARRVKVADGGMQKGSCGVCRGTDQEAFGFGVRRAGGMACGRRMEEAEGRSGLNGGKWLAQPCGTRSASAV